MAKTLYLVALLPSRETQARVRDLQQLLADDFGVVAALRSPPHITLVPPFAATDLDVGQIKDKLWKNLRNQALISFSTNGFGHFDDRVIFVRPTACEAVESLQKHVSALFQTELPWLKAKVDGPFNPHITLAYRDMTAEQFPAIWGKLGQGSFTSEERVSSVFILRHDGHRWRVFAEVPFGAEAA